MQRTATVLSIIAAALAVCISAFPLVGCSGSDPYTPSSTTETALAEVTTPFPPSGALPVAEKIAAPATGAYLGFYAPPAPFPIDQVDLHSKVTGKPSAIVMWFQPWQTGNRSLVDTGAIVSIQRRGKVPLITWEPWDPGNNARFVVDPDKQPAYRLASINAGVYDDYITQWARGLKTLGGPIMLRPMHEMNGTWYPWSGTTNGNKPEEYTAAWRHMHDIFEREGATNVTWVWSINHESVHDTPENAYAVYYPGAEYVDWTAISGFNRATSRASVDPKWISFDDMYREPLAYLRTLGKPIAVAEMATLGEPAERAEWLEETYAAIRTHPEIDAVVYFNSEEQTTEPQDWRVESSKEALKAYSAAISPDYFIGTPPTELVSWAETLTVPQWRYLTAYDPLY